MSAPPYLFWSSQHPAISAPFLHHNSNWLPVTTGEPYTGYGHASENAVCQPSQVVQSNGTSRHLLPESIANPAHQVELSTSGLKVSPSGKASYPDVSTADLSSTVPPPALKCQWRGCTYAGTFSRHAQLKRHVDDTQHINPGSFSCQVPSCVKTFNKKDKLGVHLRQMHQRDSLHWQYPTREGDVVFTG
ncbi:hypothetical protein BJX62DRAFT_239000 [Aspergillus germanicus]